MELTKDKWPESLRKIKPEVKNLFYKGEVNLLLDDSPKLAIVGSRRMTDYGARVIEKWMPVLVNSGVTIVSGFMYGVDQVAHQTCLECGGKTLAVLGWGIDWPVESKDVVLYQKLIDRDSLIVSEYGGEDSPELWKFPQRNRIVAGISDAVLVVEAAERSGSLITARLATEMQKKLLAVPGQVVSKVAEGTNGLIKAEKAKMVTTAEDVLKEMGLGLGQLAFEIKGTSNDPILCLLADGERTVDEMARILKKPVTEILAKLTSLSLMGQIVETRGKYQMK